LQGSIDIDADNKNNLNFEVNFFTKKPFIISGKVFNGNILKLRFFKYYFLSNTGAKGSLGSTAKPCAGICLPIACWNGLLACGSVAPPQAVKNKIRERIAIFDI
jgi:hypothetical protein